MSQIDLLVYRQYDYKGVKVVVRIDRVRKQVSLVEREEGTFDGYGSKKWVFAERGVEYMNGWILILHAMEHAILQAKKELEVFKNEDTEKMVQMFIALNKVRDKDIS